RWDALTENDEGLSCNEHDPLGALEYKRVEEIFRTTAPIWHVHVKGKVIRTTARHPFYVWGKGWVEAWHLEPGDRLRSDDGRMVAVEEVLESGTEEPVYNCRVADYHTYFVGGAEWEFTVWAHNQCYISQAAANTGRNRAGLIRNRNPANHEWQFSRRSRLAGAHRLPRNAVNQAVADYQAIVGPLTRAQQRQIRSVLNGRQNLQPMLREWNSSKGPLNMREWRDTPIGRNA